MLIKITQLIRSHIQSWNIGLTVEPMSSTNVEYILSLEKQWFKVVFIFSRQLKYTAVKFYY